LLHQTTNGFQMLPHVGRDEVEFGCVRHGSSHVCFQLLQVNDTLPDQKDNVLQVGLKAAIDLAESNAVWVEYAHGQTAELPYLAVATFGTIRQ
jgi:hypothetical protein